MTNLNAADLVHAALRDTSRTLTRLPGREVTNGLHEVKELGPSLARSLGQVGKVPDRVRLNHPAPMTNWNRQTSQVDVVVLGPNGEIELAAELKAWDISHQLFDLAKACSLLASGVHAAFLVCVAKRASDFDRMAGGELFPEIEGETRVHDFHDLIARHQKVWRQHAGKGTPEPTSVPTTVATTAVLTDTEILAYPGHTARAVQVNVIDSSPIPLTGAWPTAPSGNKPRIH